MLVSLPLRTTLPIQRQLSPSEPMGPCKTSYQPLPTSTKTNTPPIDLSSRSPAPPSSSIATSQRLPSLASLAPRKRRGDGKASQAVEEGDFASCLNQAAKECRVFRFNYEAKRPVHTWRRTGGAWWRGRCGCREKGLVQCGSGGRVHPLSIVCFGRYARLDWGLCCGFCRLRCPLARYAVGRLKTRKGRMEVAMPTSSEQEGGEGSKMKREEKLMMVVSMAWRMKC
ncbi:hypothetical protein IWZ01DRAFT_328905 [Phyllosticta capitalensis]